MDDVENKRKAKYHAAFRFQERLVWLGVAFVFAIRPFYYISSYLNRLGFSALLEVISEYYYEVIIIAIILLFPYLFKLIYAEYPFQYLRNKRNVDYKLINSKDKIEELHSLQVNLNKSQKISDSIFSRSNAYLLIGCLIAFAGVLVFYLQSSDIHKNLGITSINFDYSRLLLEYLPRLGTLIFVESIAFFFLRQYRQTMEEFRYYEAIKRQRENQLAIFKLADEYKDKPEIFEKLISYCGFHDNPNKLIQGESNSIIEAEKVIPQDNVIDKFLELIRITKK